MARGLSYAQVSRKKWSPILEHVELREDAAGSGRFGARRGSRTHQGIDLVAKVGEPVFAPFPGRLIRIAYPYRSDRRYSGFVIHGQGIELKLFYVRLDERVPVGGLVAPGRLIGWAQDIAGKHGPPMKNHIHIEVRKIVGAELQNPAHYLGTILDSSREN